MSGNVSALPALNTAAPDPRTHAERSNRLIRQFNRLEQDLFVPMYAADTGSATAYAIQVSADLKAYKVGQEYHFKAANANSGTAPTLNVNSLGAGTITKAGGAALVPGDIAANAFVEVQVTSTTPTFQLLSPVAFTASGATTFLAADVALNNVANFFNGPNTGSIGANGQTWWITATAFFADTAGAAVVEAAIFNGAAYIADATSAVYLANVGVTITLDAIVTLSAPATFTLRAKDQSSTSGLLLTTGNTTGIANKATSITAVRLA